jgi:hypothetical protein
MRKLVIALGVLFGVVVLDAPGWAQVVTVYSPVVSPLPIPTVIAPTTVVARPVVAGPVITAPVVSSPVVVPVSPVVTTYRPVVPAYVVPPATTYAAPVTTVYRPSYTTVPVATYGTAVPYRTGYIGGGLGGVPSVYVPGQPVRNAFRYVLP